MFRYSLRPLACLFSSVAALGLFSAGTLCAQTANYETATAGTRVTFSVSADGNPAPTFQWTREGVAIPGATATTLTLPSVTAGDNGVYNALATNAHGWALSNDLILTVNEVAAPAQVAPAITLQPFPNASATVGASLTLGVRATGEPLPTFQWLKNGIALAGATHSTLSFSSLTLDDAATYSVVVSNGAGSVTSNNSVVVVSAPADAPAVPVISTQPQSQTVDQGATVTLSASATGNPAPTFQWYHNRIAIPDATSPTYTIPAVSGSHAGVYSVIATNSIGSGYSREAKLTVR